MKMKNLSPVMVVEAIEPCLPFWTERLGFELAASVGPENARVFVILKKDGVQIMYQTRASLADDMKSLSERDLTSSIVLYIDVDDIGAVEKALAGAEIVVPRRTTFYGAHEIGVREPGGNVAVFAQHD